LLILYTLWEALEKNFEKSESVSGDHC